MRSVSWAAASGAFNARFYSRTKNLIVNMKANTFRNFLPRTQYSYNHIGANVEYIIGFQIYIYVYCTVLLATHYAHTNLLIKHDLHVS